VDDAVAVIASREGDEEVLGIVVKANIMIVVREVVFENSVVDVGMGRVAEGEVEGDGGVAADGVECYGRDGDRVAENEVLAVPVE
jgi:hypothetical protein